MNPARLFGRSGVSVVGVHLILAAAMLQFFPGSAQGGWKSYSIPHPCTASAGIVGNTYPIYVDRRGTLWVNFTYNGGSCGRGVYLFNGETWSAPPSDWPDRVKGFSNHEAAEDTSGNFWVNEYRWDGNAWRKFTLADGLGDSLVAGVLADRAGGVWFGGTPVSHFDGTSWTTFEVPGSTPGVHISAIPMFEDDEGGVWFRYFYATILRLHDGVWTTYDAPACPGQPYRCEITGIFEGQDGEVWISTTTYLGRVVGSSVVPFAPAPGPRVVQDRAGTLWSHEGSRLVRFEGNEWRPLSIEDGGLDLWFYGISDMIADSEGGIWVGTLGQVARFDGERARRFPPEPPGGSLALDKDGDAVALGGPGVRMYEGNGFRNYTTSDGLASNTVTAWLQGQDGSYWFATDVGVSRLNSGTWTNYTVADIVPTGFGPYMFEDSQGRIWVITTSGAARFDGSTWQSYSAVDGLAAGNRHWATLTPGGDIWVNSSSGGGNYFTSRFDGTAWRTYTVADGLPPGFLSQLTFDGAGSPWALSQYYDRIRGLSRFDGSEWIPVPTVAGIPADSISHLWADRQGGIWAFPTIPARGLARFDGINWTRYDVIAGGVQVYPYLARYDSHGNLWFDASGGPVRFDGAQFTSYTTQACGRVLMDPTLTDLWTLGDCGLARFNGATFDIFGTLNGIAFANPEGIIEDRFHGVWYSTDAGTIHLAGGSWKSYGPAQGFDLIVAPLLAEPSGWIWFWTLSGLMRYFPDHVAPYVRITDQPGDVTRTSDLSISFTAPFEGSSAIEYSHRFDGGTWSAWSTAVTWSQQGVSDGAHEFEVRSRDYAGNISRFPAVSRFEIDATPPTPLIASPAFGAPVRGSAGIVGTASDARFAQYQVEFKVTGSPSWSGAASIAVSTTPVVNGALGTWDTSSLVDGSYDLRLSVTDSLGLVGTTVVSVFVDNHAPFFEETAPTKVPAATGGDVYTTNAETHLYFPPHAFAQDAVVMVTASPSGSAPPSLPSGGVRALDGYEMAWAGTLKKPARFTLSYAGAALPPGTLALYRSSDGTNWERLGGTVDANAKNISLAVSAPGRYALYADNGLGAGTASLSPIAFTPRVFSPTGGFADTQVGISFTLGKPAPVTVKVYSRSGRLVREVVTGQPLSAGANLVPWDGTDRNGGIVVDGIYLVTVEALGRTETKTLAVVK